MFPTEPIRNYINLSFAKKIDEIAQKCAAEVAAARLKFPSPSGMRLTAIMEPAVESARAKIDAWVQIVRDACKEANVPVDNEVRAYIRTGVHDMCEGARQHTTQLLGLTLQRESMQNVPRERESLSAQLNQQISQIETEIGRELKIEELKENVQKSAKAEVSAPLQEKHPIPPVIPHVDKRSWFRKLSVDQKIALSMGIVLSVIAVVTLVVMVTVPELRIELGLDSQPKPDPTITIPAPRPPSDQPAPKSPPKNDSATPVTRATPAPTVQAIAPNGIANAAPNFGDQTVNNYGPRSRRITPQQHDDIVPMLASDRARVIVWSYSTDTDTWGLAKDLYGALKDSGWSMEDPDVRAAIAVNPNGCDVVVFIPGVPGQPVTQLPSAPQEVLTVLKTLGLTYGVGYSDKLGDATVKIVVGPR
jgi:hypothetical protein